MAVASRPESTPDTDAAAVAAERQQWWAEVQVGVSDLLTAAARPVEQRLAG